MFSAIRIARDSELGTHSSPGSLHPRRQSACIELPIPDCVLHGVVAASHKSNKFFLRQQSWNAFYRCGRQESPPKLNKPQRALTSSLQIVTTLRSFGVALDSGRRLRRPPLHGLAQLLTFRARLEQFSGPHYCWAASCETIGWQYKKVVVGKQIQAESFSIPMNRLSC